MGAFARLKLREFLTFNENFFFGEIQQLYLNFKESTQNLQYCCEDYVVEFPCYNDYDLEFISRSAVEFTHHYSES